jgi:hypothetical protein
LNPLPEDELLLPPELDPELDPPLLPPLEPPPDPLLLPLNPAFVLPHAATTTLQPIAHKKSEGRTRIAKLSHSLWHRRKSGTAKDASRLIQVNPGVAMRRHWSGGGAMYARFRPPGYV